MTRTAIADVRNDEPLLPASLLDPEEDESDDSFASEPPPDSVDYLAFSHYLGKQLRRLRVKRGLSLARLSAQAGVSRAMLCQIELGQSAPTITLLAKITRALRVSLASLVTHLDRPKIVHISGDRIETLKSRDGRWQSRAAFAGQAPHLPDFHEIQIAPGATDLVPRYPPGSIAQLLVTQGKLEIRMDAQLYEMVAGDALLFDTDFHAKFANPGETEARFFLVVTATDTDRLPA